MVNMPAPTIYPHLNYDEVAASLPPVISEHSTSPAGDVAKQRTLVVLEDCPSGTQTVRDITVLLKFDKNAIINQLKKEERGFWILTNSRSLHHEEVRLPSIDICPP